MKKLIYTICLTLPKFLLSLVLLAIIGSAAVLSCSGNERPAINEGDPLHRENPPLPPAERGLPPTPTAIQKEDLHFPVPPPPFSEGIYPCSNCHEDIETNPQRRILIDAHEEIIFTHDEQNRWCLDCHNPEDRDKLRLASGKVIGFEESYRLCGQCHGPKYRDWKAGAHGKRTGMWNGKKEYLLCAHCHNPHSPRFRPLVPEPPPERPEAIR